MPGIIFRREKLILPKTEEKAQSFKKTVSASYYTAPSMSELPKRFRNVPSFLFM